MKVRLSQVLASVFVAYVAPLALAAAASSGQVLQISLYKITQYGNGETTLNEIEQLVDNEQNLGSFSSFSRRTVSEFFAESSQVLSQRVPRKEAGKPFGIKEDKYVSYYICRPQDHTICIVTTTAEYPKAAAFGLIQKVFDSSPPSYNLRLLLQKSKDPQQVMSALARLQQGVDEVKGIAMKNMEEVLQRGEKMDNLVAKSENLSRESKKFYKTAKKLNTCCTIL